MTKPDFEKIFASGGTTLPLTDSQFLQGFEYLGENPPTKEEFNWLFQEVWNRLQWLDKNAQGRWQGGHTYAAGEICTPSAIGDYRQMECTVGGQSGTVEPTWGDVGSTVTDGGVTWVVKRVLNNVPYNRQIYTTAGTYTFVAPVSGLYKVTVVGGGGGGGGANNSTYGTSACGGGGGGGGHSIKSIYLTANTSVTVTVGGGGVGGASSGGAGGTGGTSSFGAHCSATGGTGGGGAVAISAAARFGTQSLPGKGNGGDLNGYGYAGFVASALSTTANEPGANAASGGGSILSGSYSVDGSAQDGILGAGGGGADTNSGGSGLQKVGAKGGDGAIIIEW